MAEVTKEELLDMVERLRSQLKACDNVIFRSGGHEGLSVGNAAVVHDAHTLLRRVKQEKCNHYYQYVCELHNGDAQYECYYCGHRIISKGAP